jgi:ribosomal-protein-alanine N-acetyltransferase
MNKMKFSPFPNLSSERLNLRQVVLADENEILVLRSDGRVMKFLDSAIYSLLNNKKERYCERYPH